MTGFVHCWAENTILDFYIKLPYRRKFTKNRNRLIVYNFTLYFRLRRRHISMSKEHKTWYFGGLLCWEPRVLEERYYSSKLLFKCGCPLGVVKRCESE